MCFFEQIRFKCGDWKWSHFRQHCNREYRIGETCGMKLIMATVNVQENCKTCDKIQTKRRRQQQEAERIQRWMKEPHKYKASIEKARDTINELEEEIQKLWSEKQKKLNAIGAQSQPYQSQYQAYQ
ncbi:hypothetical protein NA57DRAFT_57335 [Rhizodiscina lignyota]|uniref:Uncharacterized protein n=1 Tax=Rhizodiscina lignyota TaxID=1504668 RepID=A0A9P4M9V9_9PEZI|nr:hypothetical protein NA57DRAFT_57335 [Rhizodiscina lignyota]